MVNSNSSKADITNVIMWNNSANKGLSIRNVNSSGATIRNSIIEPVNSSISSDNTSSATFDSVSNSDPLLVTPVDPATAPTGSGDLRIKLGSPAIDAGKTSALPAGISTDLDGKPRVSNGTVDIGAFEFQFVPPTITSSAPPAGKQDQPYSFSVTATGTPAPTFGVTGPLPPGLTLNPTTGVLSGTPTQAGSFSFTITASNGATPNASQDVTLTIAAKGYSIFLPLVMAP